MQHDAASLHSPIAIATVYISLFLLFVLLKNIPVSNSAVSTGQCYHNIIETFTVSTLLLENMCMLKSNRQLWIILQWQAMCIMWILALKCRCWTSFTGFARKFLNDDNGGDENAEVPDVSVFSVSSSFWAKFWAFLEDSSKWTSTPFSDFYRQYNNRRLKICGLVAVKSFTAVFFTWKLEKIAVISIIDYWKLVWAKSYLGAIWRNFVWATAALAPWLRRPWLLVLGVLKPGARLTPKT